MPGPVPGRKLGIALSLGAFDMPHGFCPGKGVSEPLLSTHDPASLTLKNPALSRALFARTAPTIPPLRPPRR
jgi:hypothetical protein